MTDQKKGVRPLKSITLKTKNGPKQYVEVAERLRYFRESETYRGYSLRTEWIHLDEKLAIAKGVIRNSEGVIVAEGTAMELKGNGFINSTSHTENAETSAFGRALGILGIGVDGAVASLDEVQRAQEIQEIEAKPKSHGESVNIALKILETKFKVTQDQVCLALEILDKDEINPEKLEDLRKIVMDLNKGTKPSKYFKPINQAKMDDAASEITKQVKNVGKK